MDNSTVTRPDRARTITSGMALASAVVSVLGGCAAGGGSKASASRPGAAEAPTRWPAPPSHIPVAPGSAPGPAIRPPAYLDAPLVGAAPQWRAARDGVEISGGSAGFAARFDQTVLRFALHAGSQVPGGTGWLDGDSAATKRLVAGWNGGFLLANGASWGGFHLDGRTAFGPLRTHTASEVFYRDGTMDVLAWPGGAPGPEVIGVRQNLALLIDGGRLAADLAQGTAADEHTWGFTNDSSNVHANRSGVGVTADGRVLYAAVREASPLQLAQFLHRAGAVRAMQLDINMSRPIFGTFDGGQWHQPAPWLGSAGQFTAGDQRDFVAVYAR